MTLLISLITALFACALVLWLFELAYDYLETLVSGRRKRPEASPSASARVDRPQRSRPLTRDEAVAHSILFPTTGRKVRRR